MKSMLDYIYMEQNINTKLLQHNQLIPESLFIDKSINEIVIFATGSSYNAAQSARLFMQDLLRMPVHIKEPTLSIHYDSCWRSTTLYLAISQGGFSASIVKIIEYLQGKDIEVFAITSNMDSPVGKIAKRTLDIGMGIETMPYVTAGYAATIVFLWILAIDLAKRMYLISSDQYLAYRKQIKNVVDKAEMVIDLTEKWFQNHQKQFDNKQRFVFIGYGANYGTVLEAETKFTEILHCPTHGYELEQYMHGPYLGLNGEDALFLIDSNGFFSQRMDLLRVFLDKHMEITYKISLAEISVQEQDLCFDLDIEENLTPILLTIPIHIISYHLSNIAGTDLFHSYYPDFDEITKSKL